MDLLTEAITSGQLAVYLILLIFLEVCVLSVYWRLCSRGVPPLKLLINVSSGACIIAALWASVTVQSQVLILSLLLLSLLFHIADIAMRWQS